MPHLIQSLHFTIVRDRVVFTGRVLEFSDDDDYRES